MREPRLCFLLSPHQNAFFAELIAVFVDELGQLGVDSRIVTSPAEANDDDVFVVLPVHEYDAIEGGQWLSDEKVAARTIGITAEQPSTHHFERNVELAPKLGALFDLSHRAIAAYSGRGIVATHLPIGWTRTWDRFDKDQVFDRDLLFLGTFSPRRGNLLSTLSRALWEHESSLVISDNSAPNWQGTASFEVGESKRALIAGTRILINLHQTDEPYFERLRATEAALCGAVLMTEPSTHRDEFVDGKHLEVVPVSMMPHRIEELLADPGRLSEMRQEAYELVRANPCSVAATLLRDTARSLVKGPSLSRAVVGPSRATPLRPQPPIPWEQPENELDKIRQALREMRLDLAQLRRPAPTTDASGPNLVVDTDSAAWASRTPRLSVIMALYNHAQFVEAALESAVSGSFADVEVVVVDDGSTDDSANVVRQWISRSPHLPVRLLSHRVNAGLPTSRNDAISHARGEFTFVLDADNEVVPSGLQRLIAALDSDAAADFAYGVLQVFDNEGPVTLLGYWPWQPWRLRYGNYIDAMALFRTAALRQLGGYATDRRLYGWEDYDLWCRFAERGAAGAHVRSIVARYRTAKSSMVSLSNLSQTAAFDALRERAPRVMSGALEEFAHPMTDWLEDVRRASVAYERVFVDSELMPPTTASAAAAR